MSSPNFAQDEAFDSSGPSLEIDSDSAFGENESTLTMSVTDSVYDYKYENGRRYHAYSEGKYPVPNDEVERDRLDLQHHAFRLTLDGALYRAPLSKDVQQVLDVGTGTGIWAIEFAEEHPSATVLGTDLSPIQPTEVPPNCSFLVDDCDKEWLFHQKFDYIHTRAMVAALKNWDHLFEQAYNNLKPGGYLECQEITFPPICTDPSQTHETSPVLRWSHLFGEAAAQIGLDHIAPTKLGPKLRAAGFTDVQAKYYKWPFGSWAKGSKNKLLGKFVMEDVLDWLPSSALGLFTRVLKWSREEVEVFLSTVRRELKDDNQKHFYAHVIFWTAKRPANDIPIALNEEGIVVSNDEALESDEERLPRSADPPAASGSNQEVSSPGALVDTAANLHIRSPSPNASAALSASASEPVSVPLLSTQPPIAPRNSASINSFKDSVISLAAEITAHKVTQEHHAMQPHAPTGVDLSRIDAEVALAQDPTNQPEKSLDNGTEADQDVGLDHEQPPFLTSVIHDTLNKAKQPPSNGAEVVSDVGSDSRQSTIHTSIIHDTLQRAKHVSPQNTVVDTNKGSNGGDAPVRVSIIHDTLQKAKHVSPQDIEVDTGKESDDGDAPVRTSIIHDTLRKTKLPSSARRGSSSTIERPHSSPRVLPNAQHDFGSALGPTRLTPVGPSEPATESTNQTTTASVPLPKPEQPTSSIIDQAPAPTAASVPDLKFDFGSALGPTTLRPQSTPPDVSTWGHIPVLEPVSIEPVVISVVPAPKPTVPTLDIDMDDEEGGKQDGEAAAMAYLTSRK